MTILGIETSCDETAIAVVEINDSYGLTQTGTQTNAENDLQIKILANIVSSQMKLHAQYGGVVPNLAAREHVKNISHVFQTALNTAGEQRAPLQPKKVPFVLENIDLIAVTHGPGLGPALLVGIAFAKTIAMIHGKKLIGVNHLKGHVYSNWLPPAEITNYELRITKQSAIRNPQLFPILNLIVSGGHTELVLMRDYENFELVGETMDDAVGEAFDKVARLLGLGYPGGPQIAQHAEQFTRTIAEQTGKNAETIPHKSAYVPRYSAFKFPRPMIHSKDYNFSFSGLKTAVLYKIRDLKKDGVEITDDVVNEIAHAFQEAAVDVLIQKTIRAAQEYKVSSIFLSGGVSANTLLRKQLETAAKQAGLEYSCPPFTYTTDNAVMIALAGYFAYQQNQKSDWKSIDMHPNLGF